MFKGFSLVATLLVAMLLVMISMAFLSLSSLEMRGANHLTNQEKAEANAHLALSLAIGALQMHSGADQRVTARAAILEDAESVLANRNWLGVWDTQYSYRGEDWPLIGRKEKGSSSDTPYSREGVLQDLRHSLASHKDGAWRDEEHLIWLVSGNPERGDVNVDLSLESEKVVEILGKGTLGQGVSDEAYVRDRVLVEKVGVLGGGAYAWYISDNNQKASLTPRGDRGAESFEAFTQGNPAYVKTEGGSFPYSDYIEKAQSMGRRLASYNSVALTQKDNVKLREALKSHYHDFTHDASGLFIDSLMSGLRYDLTPLLFGYEGDTVVDFKSSDSEREFSSNFPIIPGESHAVLGPSFAALRDWAQHMHTGVKVDEIKSKDSIIRMRPAENWAFGVSDGACFDALHWASSATKIHPIMTDARWHYYFSHHNKRVRTHIIPRVCLWNPYNRDLEIPDLSVLMPNPFHSVGHGMHFFPEDHHVEALKGRHAGEEEHPFTLWLKKSGYVGGDVYKLKLNPFPETRYLAFVLKGTKMKAGECHVFSPEVSEPLTESGGVGLQRYESEEVFRNILSSSVPQGGCHFFYDHSLDRDYTVQVRSGSSGGSRDKDLTGEQVDEIDFSEIKDYQPELSMSSAGKVESFPFVLKTGVAEELEALYTSEDHVTLQLINNAAGGAHSAKSFFMQGLYWGSANQTDNSFGRLQSFEDNPLKDAADTHQIGAKLIWLDETFNEGNLAPYRHGTNSKKYSRWSNDHMVYNPCLLANWNVRAQLVTRSPVSQCGDKFYLHSTGPWIHQYVPLSPQDSNDMPSLNKEGTAFVKNPFGQAVTFSHSPDVGLFDLPSEEYGVLSLSGLRHAMLSPYSWVPSYVIGHSLRDLHSPSDSTAYEISVDDYSGTAVPTRWDYLLGASQGELGHGSYTAFSDSQGLLQIGSHAVEASVAGEERSSVDDILSYDIAYEVNHYLWDRFFISSMPLKDRGVSFDWDPQLKSKLWNQAYEFNRSESPTERLAVEALSLAGGANVGFWKNAEFLKNRAAFNVNSTSVDAWITFLSGSLGVGRPLRDTVGGSKTLSFARYKSPESVAGIDSAKPSDVGAWVGARELTAAELRLLAENIVVQVRLRGPFVSIADFVNRRLADEGDSSSRMGVIAAAIEKSKLNVGFVEEVEHRSTHINKGSDTSSGDNNRGDFSEGYRYEVNGEWVTSQPASQAWGLPGFLTQADVLDSVASALTTRGDTFTIRCYGQSLSPEGVESKAWLEAVVERLPSYVDVTGNKPSDCAQQIDRGTGEIVRGDLSVVNKKFGRRYVVKSCRWLGEGEI